MKLDMTKAFDRVCWDFLAQVMRKFGFEEDWVYWLLSPINTPYFSILVNGFSKGYFKSSRGIRQGDPISPFLFIILAETLGRGLTYLLATNKIKGLSITQNVKPITHS